jgi:hypothetical protein
VVAAVPRAGPKFVRKTPATRARVEDGNFAAATMKVKGGSTTHSV